MELRDAVLHLLIAAAQADGVFLGQERKALDEALEATGLFPGEDTRALVDVALATAPGLAEMAAAVPPDLHARVYGLCADLVVSDGRLVRAESQVLERIRHALRLPRETADHLLASATSRKVMRERP